MFLGILSCFFLKVIHHVGISIMALLQKFTKLAQMLYRKLGIMSIVVALVGFCCFSDFYYHYRTLNSELLRKQEKCKLEYSKNNCEPSLRLEAAEEFCE